MYSHSQTPELENLYCSKCSAFLGKVTEHYVSVYCSSCWNNMKTTYLQHITELTRELEEKNTEISDLEENLAESDDLALGGSGGR